jgi:hypothetical protein
MSVPVWPLGIVPVNFSWPIPSALARRSRARTSDRGRQVAGGIAALIVLTRSSSRVEVAVRVHSSAGESMVTRRVAGPSQVSPIRACPVKSQAAP